MTLARCGLAAVLLWGCAAEPAEVEPGTMFVVDRGGDAILRYDAVTGDFIDVFAAGDDDLIDRPSSVRLGPDGHIYLAGFGRGNVVRYDALSTAMMGVFFWDTTELEEPVELLFRGDQLAVLGNDTNNTVLLDRAGRVLSNFGAPDMRGAHDFAFGPDGYLYVGLPSNIVFGTAIQVWDVESGRMLRHFGMLDTIACASGLAFASDGSLLVADEELGRVVRFDRQTGEPIEVLIDHGLDRPVSLDIGPDGALYVVDAKGVHRYAPYSGVFLSTFVAVDGATLVAPRSFTFVSDEAIAVARR